jgi:hypothetical protein
LLTEHYMEQQLSLHLKTFNNRVKVMNQTNAKDLTLSAAEARQLQADIFDLLTQIAELTVIKKTAEEVAEVSIEMDGGGFR